jgi:hypothetical protein
MNIFKDLFKYKLVKLYDYKNTRKDNRLNLGYDYKDKLFNDNLSQHIQRNDIVYTFLVFLNDYFYRIIRAIKTLQGYKNYTIKKDDTNIR